MQLVSRGSGDLIMNRRLGGLARSPLHAGKAIGATLEPPRDTCERPVTMGQPVTPVSILECVRKPIGDSFDDNSVIKVRP